MEFKEYPKRVYKGDESIIVNTVEEENEFLGVKVDDKENKEGVSSEVGKGEEPQQTESIKETSGEASCGSGNVQAHEGQESPVGILTTCEDLQKVTGLTKDEIVLANKMAENVPKIIVRKPGRPKKKEIDERGFVPK